MSQPEPPAAEEAFRRLDHEPLTPPSTRSTWSDGLDLLRAIPGWLARGVGETARRFPMGAALEGARAALMTGLGLAEDPDLVAKLQPWRDFFYSRYFRVRTEGAQNLPTGGVLLVGNHAGVLPLDGWVLSEAIVRERPDLLNARWLVEDPLLDAPFVGGLYRALGGLRSSPELARSVLGEGRPLTVFPEGMHGLGKSFARRYQLQRFGRGGFVKLALRAQVPIVPVAIVGSEETLPLLIRIPLRVGGFPFLPLPAAAVPLPAKWTICFGPPIEMERLDANVDKIMDRTRRTLQTMLDAQLQRRSSVFF